MKRLIYGLIACMAIAAPAYAQGLQVTNEAQVQVITVDAEGNQTVTYEPAAQVVPGDVVRYVVNLSNATDKNVSGISLTSEIPSNLLIQEGTAESENASVKYSIDGGATFAERSVLTVTEADGTRRPAEAGDLSNVMWTLSSDIPPGESLALYFLATVK